MIALLQEWRDGDVSAGEEDDCDGFADDRLCCSIMLQDDLRVRPLPQLLDLFFLFAFLMRGCQEWRDADNEI